MIKKYTYLIFLLIFCHDLFSQDCDTSRFVSRIKAAKELNRSEPDSALALSLKILEDAKKCGNEYWIGKSYQQVASSYDYVNQVDSAMVSYKMYLYYANRIKDTVSIADAYNMIGALHIYKAEYPVALQFCMKGLTLAEKVNDERVIASSYGNIGNIYFWQKKYEIALKYWLKCLDINKKLNNVQNIVILLSNISAYYSEMQDFKTAIKYLEQCLVYTKQNNDKHGEMIAYVNLGSNLSYDGDNIKALEYFFRAKELAAELKDSYNHITILNNIGDCYFRLKKYKLAEDNFMQALAIEKDFHNPESKRTSYVGLSNIFNATGNYKKTIFYMERGQEIRDSILNETNQQQINELATKYQSEKKDQENKLLNAKNTLSEQTIKNQKNLSIFLVSGILLALLLTLNVYRGYRQKKKDNLIILSQKEEVELRNSIIEHQKAVVEEKQKEVLDSIRYAKRIQQALLASEGYIEKTINRLRKGKF